MFTWHCTKLFTIEGGFVRESVIDKIFFSFDLPIRKRQHKTRQKGSQQIPDSLFIITPWIKKTDFTGIYNILILIIWEI